MAQNQKNKNRTENLNSWILLFVGMHSICLGLFIYFYTDIFYQKFFSASVENIFFVRQSGVFLFLAGLFYLYALIDLKNLYSLVLLVIFSKFTAVYFLIANAQYTLSPSMVYLAAFFDGLMGCALIYFYLNCRKKFAKARKGVLQEQYVMTKE
ncbi:MAG: hypothetical protein ACWGOD_08655 [Desulfobulbales bacterium]